MGSMRSSIIDISGKLFIASFLLLFSACASRDVAKKAYAEGDYNTSIEIWQKWVDAGYYEKNLDIINALKKSGRGVEYGKMEKMALSAYENGEKQAAFLLENLALIQGDPAKAFSWMQKGDLALSTQRDFENHLYIVRNYLHSFVEQKNYLERFEAMAQNGNVGAAYALGKFYADMTNPFYDINRSEYFYKKAYTLGNDDAGLALADLYLHSMQKEQEGVAILKNLSQKGNAKAASRIGDYILVKMDRSVTKLNDPCIATSFNKAEEFYIRTLYLEKTKELYEKEAVVWYNKAYERGYTDAMLKIIALDLKANNLDKTTNFSHMDIHEMESFLTQYRSIPKARALLATLYTQNPELNKLNIAESIYLENMDRNITEAEWKLYNFYKQRNAASPMAEEYLQELVNQNFPPAVTIREYEDILHNKNVAQNLAALRNKAVAGDKIALSYLISLHKKGFAKDVDISKYFDKACSVMPNDSALNMTIADYYVKNAQLDKGATIIRFYAQMGNPKAQYKLAKIFQERCRVQKTAYWLEAAYRNGNTEADIEYLSLVIQGIVNGNKQQAIERLEQYAKNGSMKAMERLADSYANGIVVDFDPKEARKYYLKMVENGEPGAYLKIASLYRKINDNHEYDQNIDKIYETAIAEKVPHAGVQYAAYLIKQERIKQAKEILTQVSLEKEPVAKVLLARITGKEFYIRSHNPPNNGYVLLHYAQREAKYSRRKALLYAFRAHLCNTPSSGKLTVDLMRLVNNARVISDLYEQAKSYPRCTK